MSLSGLREIQGLPNVQVSLRYLKKGQLLSTQLNYQTVLILASITSLPLAHKLAVRSPLSLQLNLQCLVRIVSTVQPLTAGGLGVGD